MLTDEQLAVADDPERRGEKTASAGFEARRVPHLPSAVIGNGSLLATLSARGELERLFWPHVDWGQHLGEVRLGIAVDGRTWWLDEPPFRHAQTYVEDTTVLETHARTSSIAATIRDVVDPDEPVLLRVVQVSRPNARLVVYARPELDESPRYGGVYVDPETQALVFYRRGRALAVGISPRPESRAGRITSAGSAVLDDVADGRLVGGAVDCGAVDGAMSASCGDTAICALAFGSRPEQALDRLTRALAGDAAAAFDLRRTHDLQRLDGAHEPAACSEPVKRLYRRSLLTFDLVTDRTTGGVVAAPELDGDFRHSGGYGFVWGRDMAFTALAFLAAGRDDLARRALLWLTRTQTPDGLWLHRYCIDGSLAPSWGLHQIDETGAIVFAFEAAWRELEDEQLDAALWPSAQCAGDALLSFHDAASGLLRPSVDLWEEDWGTHAYSVAAVAAGLRAAAAMARRHRDLHRQAAFDSASAALRDALDARFWDEDRAHYRRALAHHPAARRPTLRYPDDLADSVKTSQRVGSRPDPAVDASLLGLAWPYVAVQPPAARMRQTADAVSSVLRFPDGGIGRYEGDRYAGGNPWILTTLWLALYRRQLGDMNGYQQGLDYVVSRQTPLGLLPEQTASDGTPAWVVPLTWSHAMFVLACRPELEIVRDFTAV